MNPQLRVLFLEKNQTEIKPLLKEFSKIEFDLEFDQVKSEKEFFVKLKENPDLIIANYELSRFRSIKV